jgi:predicted aspartyl protease
MQSHGQSSKEKCWNYGEEGIPIVIVQLATSISWETKILQVDTGFSGWFLIDWECYIKLDLIRNELPREMWPKAKGFGGSRRLRAAYLTVQIPELDIDSPYVAYSAPSLGREWNLIGLRFLDDFIWIGDGKRFCLRNKERNLIT